jgi:hypothetical protein
MNPFWKLSLKWAAKIVVTNIVAKRKMTLVRRYHLFARFLQQK